MTADWSRVRAEFPALQDWTFLDTASFGQLPRRVTEAVARHFAHRDELACSDFLAWFDDMDRLRALVARLIRCQSEDVAFVMNASSALSWLMQGIDWKPGDRVVTLEDEFPNNLYSAAVLSRLGVEHIEAPWEKFYDSISPRTRLVVMSTVSYVSGFRPPIEAVAGYLRERGVLLFVDGTQSAGALCFDFSRVRPDLFAVHAYKWMVSPNGAGFACVSPELRARLQPSVVGWRSHRTWRNVDNLHHGTPQFSDAADKYEGGMLPFAPLYGMAASIEMMLELGPELIELRVLALAEEARTRLRRLGAKLLSDEAPHYDSPIIAARFDGRDVSRMARELRERRVLVSARHGNLRVSTHFYNDEQDLARLEDALQK